MLGVSGGRHRPELSPSSGTGGCPCMEVSELGCFDTLRRKRAVGSGETSGGATGSRGSGRECCPMHGAPLPVGRSSAARTCPSRTRPARRSASSTTSPTLACSCGAPETHLHQPEAPPRTRPRCYGSPRRFPEHRCFAMGLATTPPSQGVGTTLRAFADRKWRRRQNVIARRSAVRLCDGP